MTPDKTKSNPLIEGLFPEERQRAVLDYVRKTSIVVYFLTFLFIYATAEVELSVPMYYLLFAVVLIMIGLWVETDSQDARGVIRVHVFPRSALKLGELPAQVLGGFIFAAAFVVGATAISTISLKSGVGPGQFVGEIIPQIMVVGAVETLMLIVYVNVVFMGPYVYPIIFAFSHSRVAMMWTQGLFPLETIVFFVYAVAQGVIFLAIYSGRVILPEPINKLCGPVAVAVYHGGVNTVTAFSSGGN